MRQCGSSTLKTTEKPTFVLVQWYFIIKITQQILVKCLRLFDNNFIFDQLKWPILALQRVILHIKHMNYVYILLLQLQYICLMEMTL